MNKFTKRASAVVLTAALFSSMSYSNALMTYAASKAEQNVSQSNVADDSSSISDVINVISDEVYREELSVASLTEVDAETAVKAETTVKLAITRQPSDYTGAEGSQAKFTVAASGSGLSYQWQLSDDGVNWRNSSVKTAEYVTTLSAANNGRSVRCIVTDSSGKSVTSNAASMSIKGMLAITKQPSDYTGAEGSQAKFTVAASGSGLSYQWQLSDDGVNWRNSSVKTAEYSTTLSATNNGRSVRCIVTDSNGKSVTSNAASMSIKGLLAITKQPVDYTGAEGSQAKFTVAASGSGLSYQWQLSDDGVNWRNSSVKTAEYTTTLSAANNGRSVRCIVTDSNGKSVTSNAASMSIKGLLAITKQPSDYTGAEGSQAKFTVVASGSGLSYQWQLSDDGVNWRNSSVKTAEYSTTLSATNNGRCVRCIVTDSNGKSVTSNAASMSIKGLLAITKQPSDYTGAEGSQATFTVAASGSGLSYQWQLSDDGVNWRNSSVKTAEYTTTLSATNNGRSVRCIVTDSNGKSVTSNAASMSIKGLLAITRQPSDYTGAEGSQATFTVTASGSGLSYQWQLSDDNGVTWRNSSVKTAEYTTTLSAANNGRNVRCIVTDSNGKSVTSNAASMSIKGMLTITKQPSDYMGAEGSQATFTVVASGSGLSYQWQLSDDNGVTWRNSSVKTAEYTTTLSTANNGRRVRCIVTDSNGKSVTSNAASMQIKGFLAITKQPSDYTGAAGSQATFTVAASGSGLKYQWQLSDDNGVTWRDSGTNTAEYVTTLNIESHGCLVRCIITNADGKTIISDSARMTIDAPIVVITQPENYTGIAGEQVEFMVRADSKTQMTYLWQLSDDNGVTWRDSSVTSSSYWVTISDKVDGRWFRCVIRDAVGNEVISEPASLEMATSFEPGFVTRYGVTKYRYADGSYANGLTEIDGKYYYFASNIMRTGFYTISGVSFYFDDVTGAAVIGLKYVESHGKYYWFQGADGVAKGFHEDSEGIRYFNPTTGTMQMGLKTIDGKYYYFDERTGLMHTGWFNNKSDGKTYYFMGMDGAATGLKWIEGELYYFNEYFVAKTGSYTIDGAIYYFDEYSNAAKQGFYTTDYGDTYYFGSDRKAVSGWKNIDGDNYYFLEDCSMSRGLTNIDGKRYYFDFETGAAIRTNSLVWIGMNQLMYIKAEGGYFTGLTEVEGAYYYFSPDNGVAMSGMKEIEVNGVKNNYYFSPGSFKSQSGFVEHNEQKYFFDSNFKMVKGLQTISDNSGKKSTYFFDANGVMNTGRVIMDDGTVYCFDDDGKAISGWYTYVNGSKYYFDTETYRALTGWQYVQESNSRFFFDNNGALRTGLIRDDDSRLYAFDADGEPIKGWYNYGGDIYYFNPTDGVAVTDSTKIDGELYYFTKSGKRQSGYCNIDGKYYFFDPDTGKALKGFIRALGDNGAFVCYGDPDTGVLITGLKEIDGALYCFNSAGVMRSGLYIDQNGSTYSFDSVTGKALTGFALNGSDVNYYGTDGKMIGDILTQIGGNTYYFDKYGARKGRSITVNGSMHIFDSNSGIKMTGVAMNTRDGYYYALNDKGVISNSTFSYWGTDYYAADSGVIRVSSTKTIDGVTRYYDSNGEQQYGLITYSNSSGTKYTLYFDSEETIMDGTELNNIKAKLTNALSKEGWHEIRGQKYYVKNGAFVKGVIKIDGKLYGFSELTGALLSGFHKINGNYRYMNQNGVVQTGFVTVGSDTRYFSESDGAMLTGIQNIGGRTFLFLENGQMAVGDVFVGGKLYYAYGQNETVRSDIFVNSDGSRVVNSWVKVNDSKFYLDSCGNRVTGFSKVDGKIYNFDTNGTLFTGFQEINGGTGYFDSNGIMVTGLKTINGNTYHFDAKSGIMTVGFAKIDGKLYFFDENGVMQKGCFFSTDSIRYHANADGQISTGLVTIDGNQYYFLDSGEQKFGRVYVDNRVCYFDPNTGVRQLGFVSYGGKRYYYDNSEKGFPQGETVIDGKTYIFINGDGSVYTGYCMYDGKEFYLDSKTGESLIGIFSKPNGNEYYFLGNGKLGYGLQTINGKKYYFYPASGTKVDGLQSIGSRLYYFDKTDGMLANRTVKVDGIEFKLAGDGSATVLGDSTEAKLLRAGMEYLGKPYKAEVPGEDDILSCSGFVRQMYGAIGIDLSGSSYRQYFNIARTHDTVDSINYASPGDLVFYVSLDCGHGDECGFLGEIHHVAMYVGDGKIIEANRNDAHPELSCIILQDYAESTGYFPYKIVKVLD